MSSVKVKSKPKGTQDKSLIIVVPTEVSKKATKRNLIKRRIRAIFREYVDRSDKDYTVIVTPEAGDFSFWDLKEEIESQIETVENKSED